MQKTKYICLNRIVQCATSPNITPNRWLPSLNWWKSTHSSVWAFCSITFACTCQSRDSSRWVWCAKVSLFALRAPHLHADDNGPPTRLQCLQTGPSTACPTRPKAIACDLVSRAMGLCSRQMRPWINVLCGFSSIQRVRVPFVCKKGCVYVFLKDY